MSKKSKLPDDIKTQFVSDPLQKVIERLEKVDADLPCKRYIEACIDELKTYWDELNHT